MIQGITRLFPLSALLFLIVCSMPDIVRADVEATILSTVDLDKSPMDIHTTRDGKWIYILTPGEVQVYAVNTGALSGKIPVDKAISRISVSSNGDRMFLLNEKTKKLSILSVAFVNLFTLKDSPSRGPADAPVVITNFADYQ